MKRNIRIRTLLVWAVIWSMSTMLVYAAVGGKPTFIPSHSAQRVSDRLIVKFRPSNAEQAMSAEQRYAEMSRPLAADVIQQLQFTTGVQLSDLRATGTGAHVVSLGSLQGTQTVAQAVAAISKLSNVEYVEEDVIETIQAVPNDTYYTAGFVAGSPGLWAMWPVTPVAGTAPGGTGSYGADFQTAWDTSSGVGVVVAIIDTGITPHPDIVGASGVVDAGAGSNLVSPGYDFITDCRMRGTTAAGGCAANTASYSVLPTPGATDTGDYVDASDTAANPTLFPASSQANSSWHGTHVAGTIAAIGNNGAGVIGGAYGAKILPVRALGKGGGWSTDVSDAIMWAAGVLPTIANSNPAKVINLSLGSTGTCPASQQDAINAAVNAGAVVVVAAGNEDQDVANASPANCQNVISVAAVGRDGSRAYYSNFSSPVGKVINQVSVTLAAQGGDQSNHATDPGILSTVNTASQVVDTTPAGGTYQYDQGTSMATPHVSAAVALMLSYNPALTPARVKAILSTPAALTTFPTFSSASGMASYDCAANHNCGAGILNANLALQNSTTTAPAPSGGGGGGCSIMPFDANPDVSLLWAMLAVGFYWLRRRVIIARGEA